jgi:hypothetical protein
MSLMKPWSAPEAQSLGSTTPTTTAPVTVIVRDTSRLDESGSARLETIQPGFFLAARSLMTGTRYSHLIFSRHRTHGAEERIGGIAVDISQGSNRGIIPDYWIEEI